ncbi:homoserine O-acetyltransferase MetX [Algisphaera agarilytica]|uniref:Homoserine O-acetyltransferase n=1 Tax=Algisphaera agarilytica TaxID=1385975 RepID=A0A7X0H6E7_9BACT|nr:homoserine O-acetyltransferase [Algisphaera agarilytica]MBB6428665.1 homoserine O-acetyltransferase [Algisphaera agarilytica]
MNDSFASSDDRRSGDRLKHLQKAVFPEALILALGGELPGVECAYETWGTLNAEASNAVLVCHAISGDSHAAQHDADDDPGWWDELIGPGPDFAIDTEKFFVVCSNVLGGCRGTTGPGTIDPATGDPYGADFPAITVADMVAVQTRLADHLGITQWRAVVGGSLGGHQALTWATRHPERVKTCMAIATSPRLTSQALAFDIIARNAIQTDPHFHGGQYYDQPTQPNTGLAIARMLGHITYLSSEAMDAKFDPDRHDPRKLATSFEERFSVGSYLAHQGTKFTQRFDANSYVAISMALDLFDLGRTRETLIETFRGSLCDYLITSFSSDWLFTPQQSRDIVNALTALDLPVTYAEITSAAGHDAFLLPDEISQYGPLVAAKLGHTNDQPPALRHDDDMVLDLIPEGSSVLDLGCGSGRLLATLKQRGHEHLVGVEVAQPKIIEAAARGLDIIDYDLNRGLPAFTDNQFDFVILSATLQAVANVEQLFDEMLRVGRRVIVSFPNFAYKALREDYVERGRSPKATGEYDHEWYNTPNRRFPSIADVEDLCRDKGATIHDAVYLDSQTNQRIPATPDGDPNLDADTAVLVISR